VDECKPLVRGEERSEMAGLFGLGGGYEPVSEAGAYTRSLLGST